MAKKLTKWIKVFFPTMMGLSFLAAACTPATSSSQTSNTTSSELTSELKVQSFSFVNNSTDSNKKFVVEVNFANNSNQFNNQNLKLSVIQKNNVASLRSQTQVYQANVSKYNFTFENLANSGTYQIYDFVIGKNEISYPKSEFNLTSTPTNPESADPAPLAVSLAQINNVTLNSADLILQFNHPVDPFLSQGKKVVLVNDSNPSTKISVTEAAKVDNTALKFSFTGLSDETTYSLQSVKVNAKVLTFASFKFKTLASTTLPEIEKVSAGTIGFYDATLKVNFKKISQSFIGQKTTMFLEEKNVGSDVFQSETSVTLEKGKLNYDFKFENLKTVTPFTVKEIVLGNQKLNLPENLEFQTEYNNTADLPILEFKNYEYDKVNSTVDLLKLKLDSYLSNPRSTDSGPSPKSLLNKMGSLIIENLNDGSKISSSTFTFANSETTAQKLELTFSNLEHGAKYKVAGVKVTDVNTSDFHLITPYYSFESPKTETSDTNNEALKKLQEEINKVLPVKYTTAGQKEALVNQVTELFDNFKNGKVSNVTNQNSANQDLLKIKLKNATLNYSLSVDDPNNFLDLTNLSPSTDTTHNIYKFDADNPKKTLLDKVYNQHKPLFASSVKYAILGASKNESEYGRNAYDSNRIYGPTMAYDVVFKLNGLNQANLTTRAFKLNFIISQGFYQSVVMQRYRLLFITNQIWLSVYRNYLAYLKATTDQQKIQSLRSVQILLQAIYYGKNAKAIFSQFLNGNGYYEVSKFINQTKTAFQPSKIDSSKKTEPAYLSDLVEGANANEGYENILVYLNYLNMNLDLSKAKDSYYYSDSGDEQEVYISHKGGNSHHPQNQKNRYSNESDFLDITKNNTGQISKIDFNKMLY